MEGCLLGIGNNEVQNLVNLLKNEARYLCCFNSYVENLDQKKKILTAKHQDVKRKFQKGKGVFSFKSEAQAWVDEADGIIDTDTKIKKRFLFGRCPNCCWQYRKGKELAKKTQQIEDLLGRCNSNIVASRANILDIKNLSSQGFIHFESRESKFQDLWKALQDDNCNVIGLQGIGGAGKTSMAKEVADKLEESKLIDKSIFLVVSKPPDFKKIRGELAKGLDLNLEEVNEEELSNIIWSRITNMDEKLLIILDDVWEKFDLTRNLGIPSENQYKGYNLLITTRNLRVCAEMRCQTIELQKLTEEEALNLFETHATSNDSSRGLKGMPQKIVKHCGGVPVAIIAMARALKNESRSVWRDALKTLEDRGVDQNLEEAYKCLKLSYDNLKNRKAKELLLISSLFPEDFEIPIMLLIKIGIGLGSFRENDKYHLTRNEVHGAVKELMYSSLLLNCEEECIKMHDLVREVALWIGENDIQSLVDSKEPIKGNLRYLFWNNDDFPNVFDGKKLEVLSIFLNSSKDFNFSDTFFKEMTSLKVLVLANEEKDPALSLGNSLQPLKNIQTLILSRLELGDISAIGNLLSLNTLWFVDCAIIELPREFLKLKKLKSLEVEGCKIEKNNPFEVIERCSQLEELTFVGNEFDDEEKDAISQNASPLTLHRYCVASEDFSDYFETYGSMSRCFRIDGSSHLISNATLKQFVRRAELLILEGEDAQRIWKNLIPDIVAVDEGGMMNDLIVLNLSSCPNMECIIDTRVSIDSGVTALCNLAELRLYGMGVEDLCRGPLPSGFLEQLEIMELMECHRLESVLFNASYNLCHLKSLELKYCPKLMSIFQPSTARSLMQLQELTIRDCNELEYIIVGEDGDSNQKSYYDSLFPKLKTFQIEKCNKLSIILPILFAGGLAYLEKISIGKSEQLEYIFDKFQEGEDAMLPSLKELQLSGVPSFIGIFRQRHPFMSSSMQKPSPSLSRHNSNNINQSPASLAFSWVQACCSLNKSRPTNEVTNVAAGSKHRPLDHVNPPELAPSTDRVFLLQAAQSLLVQSLKNVREIKLVECGNLISLSTLSIAASTISLENLTIWKCHKLKCITTHEGDAQVDNRNYCSIFPTLEHLEIKDCRELEFVFQSAVSGGLQKLKSLTIWRVPQLIYVVGNCQKEQHSSNQNDELHFDLPALEILFIQCARKMNSICSNNYKSELSSLKNVDIWNCGIKSFIDYDMVDWTTTEELDGSTGGVAPCHAAQSLLVQSLKNVRKIDLMECGNLVSLSTLSIAASTMSLENLRVSECHRLKCITTHEGNAQVDKNYCSIFPTLDNLEIWNCKELEFVFVPAISGGLQKLKSLTIWDVPELKCVVVNKFGKEQHSSNHNQNDELHFDLPALETLSIGNAPKMKSIICAKNYKMVMSSLHNVQMWNCSIESLNDYNMVNLTTTEEFNSSADGVLPFHASQIFLDQSLKNVRKIELWKCWNLISLSTLPIATSTILLEDLEISYCEHLKCIVEDEGDVGTHMNYNSIFPKLKRLQVSFCNALEYLFPAYAFRCPVYLESLKIHGAPVLKYVFERSQYEDNLTHQNQTKKTCIEFPALNDISFWDVPVLVSIYPKNYCLRVLSPMSSIDLRAFSEFTRPFKEFLFCWHAKQQETKAIEMCGQTSKSLKVWNSKIKEIVDLTHVDTEKNGDGLEPLASGLQELTLENLSELVNICMGPKHIICFNNFQKLCIHGCKQLKVIFSASIVRSLPMLKELRISWCAELVDIVEEDYETNDDDHLRHKPCFPNLEQVSVHGCHKLKYLFSVTISDIFPKLRDFEIKHADELERVLVRQGEMKEVVMKDVLPQLSRLELINLPKLFSLCHGIDFQTLKGDDNTEVDDCPKFSFYEISTTQLQASSKTTYSQVKEKPEEKLSSNLSTEQYLNMGEATQQSLTEGTNEDAKEIVEEGIIFEKPKKTNLLSDSNVIGQSDDLVGEINERIMIDPQQSIMGTQDSTKDESVNDKEVKKETIMEPQSKEKTTRHDIQSHGDEEGEEEREGGLITIRRHRSDIKVKSSFLKEKPETSIHVDPFVPCSTTISSEQTPKAILPPSPKFSKASLCKPTDDDVQVSDKSHATVISNAVPIPQPTINNDKDINETIATQDESKTIMASHGGPPNSREHMTDDPSNLKQMEQEPSCSRGQMEHHDVTKYSDINQALNVGGVQEIVEMMKLEGSETCLLEEAFKNHPQLRMSTNDRSTQMLCISYRVLIDILHILTTRTPFTITEADKRLLEEKLKDACLLGFDKDWVESVRTKVFNCDVSEVNEIQEILKDLDGDLKTNEALLAVTRNQGVEAARLVQKDLDTALQEHANVMANNTQLLKARQEILAMQNQCWEMIAARNKHFGF